ncbi:SCO7613 C-terminal domain-containing membrane protein, partial [Cellulomonas shaoxiangyii]
GLLAGTALAVAVGTPPAPGAGFAAVVVVAVLLARARRRTAPRTERHAAVVTAAAVAVTGWMSAWAATAGPSTGGEATVGALLAAAAAGAVVVALLADVATRGRGAVTAGAAAAAPVAALAVATVRTALGAPPPAGTVLAMVAVGATSVLAAHLVTARGGPHARTAGELAGWCVVACGVLGALLVGRPATAAALAVAAAAAGGWAAHRDRRSAWWLAWGLGSAAWCVVLGAPGGVLLEPYVVPPGLALVVVGALRLRRRTGGAAPLVAGGAALATLPTAVLPAALDVGERWLDRGLLTTALAGALAWVAVALARRGAAPDASRTAGALAGLTVTLALLGPARRAVTSAVRPPDGTAGLRAADGAGLVGLVEPWGLAAGALLVAGAVVALRTWPATARRPVARLAPWAVLAVTAGPTLLATLATADRGTAAGAARLGTAAAVATAAALLGARQGRRVPAGGASTVLPRPAPPGAARAVGPRLADLGLALATATAAAATAWVPASAVDVPAAAVALVALVTVTTAARARTDVPAWWLVLGVVALAPPLLVRAGELRPVAWVAGAVLLLALAHLARQPQGAGSHGASAGTGTTGEPVAGTDAPSPHARAAATVGPTLVVRTLAAAAAGVAVLGPWADALTAAVGTALGAPTAGALVVEVPALLVAVLVAAALHLGTGDAVRAPWRRAAVVALLVVPLVLAVDATHVGALRAAGVLALGALVALRGRARHDEGLGLVVAAAAGTAAALRGGPEPIELPVVLVGLLAVALGLRRAHRDAGTGSWVALGVPVAVTLGAPLAGLLLAPTPWRATVTLTLALAATVGGAVRRLQAPFLLGAAAALTAAAVLLTPLAADALTRVDGWVLLGLGGAAVLALGLTYERRVREAREAVRVVAAMR